MNLYDVMTLIKNLTHGVNSIAIDAGGQAAIAVSCT